jgi:hypothetical protein
MPNRSKGRDQVGGLGNKPTQEKSTLMRPPEPMEECKWKRPRFTQFCSASKEEEEEEEDAFLVDIQDV